MLEGKCDWQIGNRQVRAMPRTYVFMPPEAPHGIGNATDKPTRVITAVSPPGHEYYFEELAKMAVSGKRPDAGAIAEPRRRHDTDQPSALKNEPPSDLPDGPPTGTEEERRASELGALGHDPHDRLTALRRAGML